MGWMECNREVERDRQVLQGILAYILSFAAMAGQASSLPDPILRNLLVALRPAEACVRDFVIALARDCGAPLPPEAYLALSASADPGYGDEPERLALSFRALALVMTAILAQASRLSRLSQRWNALWAGRALLASPPPHGQFGSPAGFSAAAPIAPDTS